MKIGVTKVVECPNCNKQLANPNKTWTYLRFDVEAYSCGCGAKFRRYMRKGKHIFTLKLSKDGRWRKIP